MVYVDMKQQVAHHEQQMKMLDQQYVMHQKALRRLQKACNHVYGENQSAEGYRCQICGKIV